MSKCIRKAKFTMEKVNKVDYIKNIYIMIYTYKYIINNTFIYNKYILIYNLYIN